jgi:hypothetical protein
MGAFLVKLYNIMKEFFLDPLHVAGSLIERIGKAWNSVWGGAPAKVVQKTQPLVAVTSTPKVEQTLKGADASYLQSLMPRDVPESNLIGAHTQMVGSAPPEAAGYYQGVIPGSPPKDPIDYKKLAETLASQPIMFSMDGVKFVGEIKRIERSMNSLNSNK